MFPIIQNLSTFDSKDLQNFQSLQLTSRSRARPWTRPSASCRLAWTSPPESRQVDSHPQGEVMQRHHLKFLFFTEVFGLNPFFSRVLSNLPIFFATKK